MRSLTSLFLAGATVAIAMTIAGLGSAAAAQETCRAGVFRVPGGIARTFCGTARATVAVNGKTYLFKNGKCDLEPKYVVVNIGTVVLGGAKKKAYFGLELGKSPAATAADPVVSKDGTYRRGLITMQVRTFHASLYNVADLKITLTHHRSRGTFSGTKPGSSIFGQKPVKISGSFRC